MPSPTPREKQIICLTCEQELTIAEISQRLGTSVQTVKRQRHTLFRRLGVRNMFGVCTKHGRATMVRDMEGGQR